MVNTMNKPIAVSFLRMSDLANYPSRPERCHIYKSGQNQGQVKYIRARTASKGLIGVSEKTIWQWIKQGNFPAPVKIGSVSIWRSTDIQAWMDAQGQQKVQS